MSRDSRCPADHARPTATASHARSRERGFALLLVLWALGLLSLLVSVLAGTARTEIGLATTLRGSAVAEAAADGAIQQAIFQLHTGAWTANGVPLQIAVGRASVAVTIDDQGARINPNFASPALLATLLGAAGVSPGQALALARRIVDWRTDTPFSIDGGSKLDRYRAAGLPYGPANRPFASVDEIALVPGMTTELVAALRPYVSVDQTGDPHIAEGVTANRSAVQDAEMINRAAVLIGFTSPIRIVQIRALATLAGGIRFVRSAVVRLPVQPGPDQPAWQILTWESG